jgi:hypothetical protein
MYSLWTDNQHSVEQSIATPVYVQSKHGKHELSRFDKFCCQKNVLKSQKHREVRNILSPLVGLAEVMTSLGVHKLINFVFLFRILIWIIVLWLPKILK